MMVHSAVTLHARLREVTQPAHLRLEASLKLLERPANAARMRRLLGRFHGFHASWEPALRGVVPESFLETRLKLPLLEQDLRSLGAEDELLRALPTCPGAVSLCRGQASAAGSLYVLEGSTLGGHVINRRLSDEPWYPPQGLTYWNSYGVDTGRRWKETLAYLESLPGAWSGEIVDSAHATFELLHSWLQPACLPDGDRG
jgi:heme oxygenase (biliverdin-IX-beta and delta-forming)